MSDYLSRVAAQALGRVEVVRPRLSSLFEPASMSARSASGPEVQEWMGAASTPAEDGAAFDAGSPTLPAMRAATGGHLGAASPAAAPRDAPAARQPGPSDVAGDPIWSARPLTGNEPEEPGHAARPSRAPGDQGPPAASPTPPPSPRSRRTPALPPSRIAEPAVLEPDRPAPAPARGRVSTVSVAPVPESLRPFGPPHEPAPPARPPGSGVVVAQPQMTRHAEPPPHSPAESRAIPAPAPTIKVTIGRVEVRAIMPPAAAPRPARARPGPALSLEDYLKQRRERAR